MAHSHMEGRAGLAQMAGLSPMAGVSGARIPDRCPTRESDYGSGHMAQFGIDDWFSS